MEIALQLFVLFFSIVLHECAHGWVALLRGDRTAKEQGRLTLNPLPHVDIIGTVLLPLLQWITMGKVFFGYAKPVPINPFLMKNPKRDILWVSLAGPVTNLIIGVLAGLAVRLYLGQVIAFPKVLAHPLMIFCVINLWLALVNLVPIPPLDGSRIITGLLPNRALPKWIALEQVGFFILILLISTGFFDTVLAPILNNLIVWITGLK